MIKQLLNSVFVISRIIKVSVRVITKPHPIIVYNNMYNTSMEMIMQNQAVPHQFCNFTCEIIN